MIGQGRYIFLSSDPIRQAFYEDIGELWIQLFPKDEAHNACALFRKGSRASVSTAARVLQANHRQGIGNKASLTGHLISDEMR